MSDTEFKIGDTIDTDVAGVVQVQDVFRSEITGYCVYHVVDEDACRFALFEDEMTQKDR